ncbi:hypothetical protein PORY_001394 [Pneumocystis oryctolagi]|uniref:Uncharacterized protein n=1 Tax=Pneumocystis oryctolagi TaxID=42067 RepID=A0ACB7CI50_9ASCO|nr:hypothetical protein PORY_001394 [Pneumocystis oryctolagi]
MTSKKYINFEKLNEPTFNAYLFANTLVKETHHHSDNRIDLDVPLRKVQYDLEEIDEKIQEEIKRNYKDIIEYVNFSKETINEDMDSIKKYAELLITTFHQVSEKWTKKYDNASCLLNSLKNIHETNQLLLKVHESLVLIQRLESLDQKISKDDNNIDSWKSYVEVAVIIYQWRTLQNDLKDISIVTEYVSFVTSFSEKLESIAYDVLFVQKCQSKPLLVFVILTYFLLNEDSLVFNLNDYNEKCINASIECFCKGIEIKPALKRLSTVDPIKARTTLLMNIEKSWESVEKISENIYILNAVLNEPVQLLLKEIFLSHGDTILCNILKKLNNQSPIQYFWQKSSSQIIQKIKNTKKQSLCLIVLVEDKTFGLKNKNKSSKVQAQIRQLESQAAQIGKNKISKEKEAQKKEQAEKKIAEESRKMELAELFKQPIQKVPFGVDPKSVLCQYYKQGFCDKGKKCKFSHNLDVEKKSEKKDIYTDFRQAPLNSNNSYVDKKNDTIETWDDEKFQSVILSKHGNPKTTTNIVCKFFLEAIEKGVYGWFWVCPNDGDNCKYKHSLPPGFVFKNKQKDKEEVITLEQFLEIERHKLGPNLTPVTLETFTEWKRKREEKKEQEEQENRRKKEASIAAGRVVGLSGRELFEYNPIMYEEEEDEPLDLSEFRKAVDDIEEDMDNDEFD